MLKGDCSQQAITPDSKISCSAPQRAWNDILTSICGALEADPLSVIYNRTGLPSLLLLSLAVFPPAHRVTCLLRATFTLSNSCISNNASTQLRSCTRMSFICSNLPKGWRLAMCQARCWRWVSDFNHTAIIETRFSLSLRSAAAVLAARRRLCGNIRPRDPTPTPQEPIVIMDVDSTPWAYNLKIPDWNINFPDAARRHTGIFEDTPKARSAWSGWGTAFPSSVLESTSVSPREPEAHEESVKPAVIPPPAHPKADEAQANLPASSAESSPIRSRKAEKSRLGDEPVDIPPTSPRKAEKARARDDPAEPEGTRRVTLTSVCLS